MKLFFNHVVGKVTDMDFYYSPVYAHVEYKEVREAVHSGWLINEWDKSEPKRWFQSRVVRLDLSDWEISKSDEKRLADSPIKISTILLEEANIDDMKDVYHRYIDHKSFPVPLNWENMLNYDASDVKIVIQFHQNNKLIAWTLCRFYGTASTLCSLQFAWDYENPRLEVGKLSQLYEMKACKLLGLRYHNLCSGYETASLWKSSLHGFEWWTGTEWSKDKELYSILCKNDSMVFSISECVQLEERYAASA